MDLKITGFQELQRELESLEPKIRKKVLGKAVRAGSNIVKKDARAHAPKQAKSWEGMQYSVPPGTLKKGIIVRRATRQPRYIVRDLIGFSKQAWYGRLVEMGHKLVRGGRLASGAKNKRKSSGGGKVIGHVAAKPFLRPAFDNNVDKVIAAMAKVLKEELGKLK